MPFVITSTELPTPLLTGDTAELTILLTALNPESGKNVQEFIPKLTVGGDELYIRACNWQKQRGAIGVDCGFTLADIADRSLINANSSLTFQIGVKESGVTTWHTIASLQKLAQRSFQIAGDTFSFRSISGVSDKLNTSPVVPFLMYDPDKVPFDANAIDKLYDTEGHTYAVEAIPVSGLMLSDILEEIFVNRCGFDAVWTDIEDFRVPQLSVDISETYHDALAPIIEAFSAPNTDGPLYAEKDGTLKIFDTSNFIPADFPQPRDLSIFGCSELSIDTTYSDVVAARLVFSVPDAWDYTTNRIAVSNVPIGNDSITGEILFKLTVENYWQMRSHALPNVILDERKQFSYEYIRTVLEEIDVSQEVLTNYFDKYARPHITVTERWSRLPDGTGPNAFIGTNPDEREIQFFNYAQHPTKIGRQFQQGVTRHTIGRISVDADNPYLDAPFRQALKLAHWVGNANEGITVEQGALRTYQETVTPQRNGQVTRRILDFDNVRNLPVVSRNDTQVADVSLNGDNSKSRDLIVTEFGDEYTGGRIIDIHVGAIPLEIAIPLVRRKLKKMRMLSQDASLNIVGFDPMIEIGAEFAASDKLEQVEGNFICESFAGSGENLGTPDFKWSMTVGGMGI
jgi:hypothetical protein